MGQNPTQKQLMALNLHQDQTQHFQAILQGLENLEQKTQQQK